MTGSGCTLDIHDIQAGNTISIAFPINFKEKLDATNRQCKQLATATMQAHSFVTRRQVYYALLSYFTTNWFAFSFILSYNVYKVLS